MCRSCINIEGAKLDPFIERGGDGYAWFANRARAKKDDLQLGWAVFRNARIKRNCLLRPLDTSVVMRKASTAITKAAALSEARGWIPMNPLQAYTMRVEDVRLAKRAAAKQRV